VEWGEVRRRCRRLCGCITRTCKGYEAEAPLWWLSNVRPPAPLSYLLPPQYYLGRYGVRAQNWVGEPSTKQTRTYAFGGEALQGDRLLDYPNWVRSISRKAPVNVPIVSPFLLGSWAGTSSPALAVSG
jgi:hypothetical protein